MATFYSCLRGKKRDCGIMASGSADAPAAPESSDASEECPAGKKKSRFQTFKNFFAKKKKKEAAGPVAESEVQLKFSQSVEDVHVPEPPSIHTDKDSDSSSTINVGSKALSQDSVFTSDPPSPETNEALQSSQDSIHGKVKSLQMQLKQAIRLGSPPAVISVKKGEDGGAVSEDDGLPCSPPEYSTIHTVLSTSSQRSSGVVQRSGSLSLEGSDSDDDQMSGASSRPGTPQTSIPVDFSEPASSLSCLDCSAAHHRIAVKSRACAKRKPASREMLQPKRRDLRERVLLRDTEDKLRAARTSTGGEEEEENKDDEELNEVQHDSPVSASVLAENEEELPASSQRSSTTTSASAEASEDDECASDRDQVASFGILDSSWENPVTLELQTDDFLLDGGCEVVTKEQGSLLEEVLSSLKGPLVSGLVLECEATAEQMEVEDTAGEDVLDNLDVDGASEHPESRDPSSVLDDQLHVENTFSESATLLQEAENIVQEDEVPEEQEFAEKLQFPEEDLQLHEGSMEKDEDENEEDQDDRKDLEEEEAEDEEIMEYAGEEVVVEQEDESTEMEENMDEVKKQEGGDDFAEEADQEEEMVIEDNKKEIHVKELHQEEKDKEEEEETKDQSCQLEDEEQEINLDTSIDIESFHETEQSIEGTTVASMEVVNQPEDLVEPESPEQPSFVVMTSVELSFPKKPSPQPKEAEHVSEILHHEILKECEDQSTESLQIDDEQSEDVHQEEVLSASHQSSTPKSEAAEESIQELSHSMADDEPVFNQSPSRDQSSVSMTAEQSASHEETQSLPSSPLQREICQADEDTTPENPFGVRLRKTPVLHRYASEGETPNSEPVETPKSPFLEQLSKKPILPKKPDQVTDGVVKPKRTSDLAGKVPVESSESPSWISLARQKQKVFKESSLDESLGESKEGLSDDLPGPVPKDQLKPVASPVKVSCSLEISKPALVEKEKRNISHPVPAPLTQDEPPWLALAKKKAKAWSEMPQIVQ